MDANGQGVRDAGGADDRPAKRVKTDPAEDGPRPRQKGVASIKPEYLLGPKGAEVDDDRAEAAPRPDGQREKHKGQNKGRRFGQARDAKGLCSSRALYPELSPAECKFGDNCRFEHDLRKYLKEHKRKDLETLNGKCPVYEATGRCGAGWKCRFVGSHMEEHETADGGKELVLLGAQDGEDEIVNVATTEQKMSLSRRDFDTSRAETFSKWLDEVTKANKANHASAPVDEESEAKEDLRAQYTEPPFLPSEKRKVYFGPETPLLAPLTTQGNMPFRRLCVDLGAQLTYCEMAMSTPLVQGQKSEWALLRAHQSELSPPAFGGKTHVVQGYDNSKDLKFAAQIAGNKYFMTLKATEAITRICPHLRVIDLNCGCPIDLVYKQGAGSALLDSPAKLEKMIVGMNAVSDEIPITAKIRMGTKDGKPTAAKLIDRLVFGNAEGADILSRGGGVAAITLHGRSRQQRYTRSADWKYIAECAALIQHHRRVGDDLADTVREADDRYRSASQRVYFVGNGDCYSYEDYREHVANGKVDSVMVARGALIKPWIFEEIEKGQYIDKSATERLALVERFVRYGLETWGSDEMGVGLTRRFLLEWLSFAYRYVPVGIMEHLPPSLQDRPPAWRGRNDLETLLGSDNYKDWIKISEMFLGPAHDGFKFQPKHKSNSYEIQAEG